ncbi:hypothetical protein I5Q34_32850 [Streptomyces sp. AV19]|uniref:hypothetical protein n=1 Tax=Streptomyces sp. AV19 TaxID=2793068 RepID=UPI0018FEE504|nr:hypothetical protein [Streptomyces sp. AV19]MBH1938993.1 hypothetical protein [Streptomyces sp. AV19]MDG4536806.1 hypothetical protein [Streptomyces sp. AV19]
MLDEVICRDAEDMDGCDEFYISGTVFSAGDQKGRKIHMDPVKVKAKTSVHITSPILFQDSIPDSGVVTVNLFALDADAGRAWSTPERAKILKAVGDNLRKGAKDAVNYYYDEERVNKAVSAGEEGNLTPETKTAPDSPKETSEKDKPMNLQEDLKELEEGIRKGTEKLDKRKKEAERGTKKFQEQVKEGAHALIDLSAECLPETAELDEDDCLGRKMHKFSADDPGEHIGEHTWELKGGTWFISDYDYTVKYSIYLQ